MFFFLFYFYFLFLFFTVFLLYLRTAAHVDAARSGAFAPGGREEASRWTYPSGRTIVAWPETDGFRLYPGDQAGEPHL